MSQLSSIPRVIWVAALLLVSCSSRGADPIAAPSLAVDSHPSGCGNAILWGMWDISINPITMSATVTPKRNAGFTCNVTRFLQPPISTKNLVTVDIDPSSDFVKGLVSADITLTHPFPGMDFYTGFDVRGVVIGNGSVAGMGDPGILYSGSNDLRLLNADGLTRWFNPTEFTTYGKLFGFTRGSKGTPSYDFTATLNGYRYFCENLDKDIPAVEFFADPSCPNRRGCFRAGSPLTRRYELQFPMESGKPNFHFQYAIAASWLPSTVEPPKNVPDDFPISANCAEAYALSISDMSEMYYVSDSIKGGSLNLMVQVYDHQGSTDPSGVPGEIGAILLETPSGPISGKQASFSGAKLDSALVAQDAASATYLLVVPNADPQAAGSFPVLVVVESSAPSNYDSGIPGFVFPADARLSSYSIVTVSVAGDFGWTRTWGNELDDWYSSVATDPAGNIYVTGYFGGTVDFDPGPGIDLHTACGPNSSLCDAYLCKFDSNGIFQWARTWGGDRWDSGHCLTVDSAGNSYVVGTFLDTVDFDPGPGVSERSSNGYSDVFVSKFDTYGDFQWVTTWGGDSEDCDYGENICLDNLGNLYVTGKTAGTVDFDPGPGEDIHVSNGGWDIFLSKFDISGNFEWARTWGGLLYDAAWGVAADAGGNPCVVGWFMDTVDFDPGPGIDNHVSNGAEDCFLSKFDGAGNYQWVLTWGGPNSDMAKWIAIDNSGNMYLTGFFGDTVDFDPGPGVLEHSSNGKGDVFLSKLNSSGGFLWADTWGGSEDDSGNCVAVNDKGEACVNGLFFDSVDFDPGPGADYHTSNGLDDIFTCKYGTGGNLQWAVTWGAEDSDQGGGVAMDSSGHILAFGHFALTVDFDPGPGVDYHTSAGDRDDFLIRLLPDGTW